MKRRVLWIESLGIWLLFSAVAAAVLYTIIPAL